MDFGKDVGFGDLYCGILDGKYLWDGFPVDEETFNDKMMARINTLKEQADAKNDLRAELHKQDLQIAELKKGKGLLCVGHGKILCACEKCVEDTERLNGELKEIIRQVDQWFLKPVLLQGFPAVEGWLAMKIRAIGEEFAEKRNHVPVEMPAERRACMHYAADGEKKCPACGKVFDTQ